MSTRDLVDPELLSALEAFPQLEFTDELLQEIRAGMLGMLLPQESYARPDVTIEERSVPGPETAPPVRVLIYRPTGTTGPLPALIHIHGGGYVLGTPEMSGPGNVRTAAEIGCLVVSVDYRLAPETRAPGAVEDCYAVLRWVHGAAGELGIDPGRIAIGGESAGGGLAAALALLARDRGEVPICFQMLIYPMLDDRTAAGRGSNQFVGEYVWTRTANEYGWRALLGHAPGITGVSPYAAAARAEYLAGLPPAFISVGALDLFLEEDIDYATRLLCAGVATELIVYPGAYHGFEMAIDAAVSKRAEADRRTALSKAFARQRR